jgi:hypothetical protein
MITSNGVSVVMIAWAGGDVVPRVDSGIMMSRRMRARRTGIMVRLVIYGLPL